MSTTSSSRADRRRARAFAVAVALFLAGCPGPPPPSPDLPAGPVAQEAARPPAIDRAALTRPVELKSVAIHKLDPALQKMAGPSLLKTAKEPLAIDVHTAQPLDLRPRDASPMIYLNGKKFPDTWALPPDRLVAFLPDRTQLKESNNIAVAWAGNERATLSAKPLTILATDVNK